MWIVGATVVLLLCNTIPLTMGRTHGRHDYWTQAALKDLVLGIKNYQVEYNRYPLLKGEPAKADPRLESSGPYLAILMGKNIEGLNPREISYLEPPMGKNGKGGLIHSSTSGEYKLVDRWGRPYIVLIDANYDNQIDNPDIRNSSPLISKDAPATLTAEVIAFSVGPDGVEGTADDITSWRPPLPGSALKQWVDTFSLTFFIMLISILIIFAQGLWLMVDMIRWLASTPSPAGEDSSKP
ncbi:MAG: hypothetical protein JWO94_3258 [Verrucomicrobiaceae bacterium]|nr:hypothetical protein [Verrucomicrobiaceae bacterium]